MGELVEVTVNAPLDRNRQIKLMQEAEARMAGRARAWMSNPAIRAVFAKAAMRIEAVPVSKTVAHDVAEKGFADWDERAADITVRPISLRRRAG